MANYSSFKFSHPFLGCQNLDLNLKIFSIIINPESQDSILGAGDDDLFADVLKTKKEPKATKKRKYDLADLSEFNEEKPTKKAKTTKKVKKVDTEDDIEAMLMATEGKQRLSDKENASPVKKEPAKRKVTKGSKKTAKKETGLNFFFETPFFPLLQLLKSIS